MFEIPEHIILSQGTKINILFEHLFCYFMAIFCPLLSKQLKFGKLTQKWTIVPDLGHLFVWRVDKVRNSDF